MLSTPGRRRSTRSTKRLQSSKPLATTLSRKSASPVMFVAVHYVGAGADGALELGRDLFAVLVQTICTKAMTPMPSLRRLSRVW